MIQNISLRNGVLVIIFNKYFGHLFYGLRWKLVVTYLLISIVPLLFFSNTIALSLDSYFKKGSKDKYLNTANVIAGTCTKSKYLVDKSLAPIFEAYIYQEGKTNDLRVLVFDTKGTVLQDSSKMDVGKTILISEVLSALNKNDTSEVYKDEEAVYAAATVETESSQVLGAVLVVASISENYELLSEINKTVIFLTLVVAVIIFILVFTTSKLMIEPLSKFSSVVKSMAEGRLDQRVKIHGRDEFTDLSVAFNQMAEKLEEVEKTREEFVANVSHELKTPLSSIKVLTESILLQESVPTEMYKEFLQDINSEIDRMTNIVNDLLTIVKLDQREIGLNLQSVELSQLISDILKRLFPIAEQKNIDLRYENKTKIMACVDEMKLALAISNLIENAIKYTDDGGVVKVILDSDHQHAFITVQDTGIGIKEEDQSKVFHRFYRVDKTRDRETGGTGLGLAITHSTVLLHNGSIRLSSKYGEGSSFVVRIPLQQ